MSATSLSAIGVLDDHPIVAAGLTQVFHDHDPDIEVVRLDARTLAHPGIDVVLCDAFNGTVGAGPDLQDLTRRTSAKVVLYAGELSLSVVDLALRAGITAYLPKRSSTQQVVATVEAVHRGEPVSTPAVGTQQAPAAGEWPGHPSDLSPRELEIIVYIASGRSNDEIARELFLGLNTVKTYIRGAYRKIGVQRRTHAVLWAIDNGVVSHSAVRSLLGAPDPHDHGSRLLPPAPPVRPRPRPRVELTAV